MKKKTIIHNWYKANVIGDFYVSEKGLDGADANDLFTKDRNEAHRFNSRSEAKQFAKDHGITDYDLQD